MKLDLTDTELYNAVCYGKKPLFYDAKKIADCAKLATKTISPDFLKKEFKVEIIQDGVLFSNSTLKIQSQSLKKHLKESSAAILFCVTLGRNADKEIEKAKAIDMQSAILLDIAFLELVEKACDEIVKIIQSEHQDKKLTTRFSLGYGDSPLELQSDFLRLLDAERRLGVLVTEGGMMLPSKTVTAIVGIKD